MRAQRIKTGFHRIGVAIAVVIAVPSISAMLMSVQSPWDGCLKDGKSKHLNGWLHSREVRVPCIGSPRLSGCMDALLDHRGLR
jgi:hypothetical protein